ncbi:MULTISPECIES: DNA cytosine methyltransferase [unclassified Rhizobium]|uniref:DNA cytosine methyltransferase n=1 Tax=unclassified Rhizobium TaxID=2613769 RepID=UPI00177F7A54|nr:MULTISPECIES: DNA (cytosine-5-)-methyltransferase [unclassified Rhizobium]MBD8687235.1 DNA (cytosine-5-)-methyltransferase [Rhizobium sp. CFBP 13644]MBD8690962.1 DNA (cytosine-5-)-methyltransferase [Rhizobium sp. CFBP 13717]
MTGIDPKAQALSAALRRISDLQQQMTDRVLAMAVEIEKLTTVVPAAEAKAFLKARCNLPATELSTYMGVAMSLRGSEDILREARASFPVVKALVAADPDTRQEVLERMEIGARIDTKDIALIKKRLADARLTPAEALTAANRKAVAAAVRRQAKAAVASFEERAASFVDELRQYFRHVDGKASIIKEGLRHQAGILKAECDILFGKEEPTLASLRPATPAYRMAMARKMLGDIASGQLGEIGPMETRVLSTLTGQSRMSFVGLSRKPLAEIPPQRYRPRVVELCAGAGGLALGLERAGFEHVALIEMNRNAVATLRANRPNWNVVQADVRKVDFSQYHDQRIDLLTGGLPCTPFSTVGQKKGRHDENNLMMEGVRAVREIAPKAFLFENVEGLLHSRHADYVAFLLREFSKAGYSTEIHRINAKDYGVPQNRSRIMLVGMRKDLAGAFRMPRKFPELSSNVGDALADLMSENGWSGAEAWLQAKRDRDYRADTIRGYQGSAREGEAIRADRRQLRYAPPAKSAPTEDEGSREGFAPGLTNRMRARLQGFPDTWEFIGGHGPVADQIGNAVVPAVAQAMGLAMVSALKGWEIDWDAMFRSSEARLSIEAPSLVMRCHHLDRASNTSSASTSTIAHIPHLEGRII